MLAPVFQGFHMVDIASCDFICTCQITQSAHLLIYTVLKFSDYFLPGSWDILYVMKSREYDVISNCQLTKSAQFPVMYLPTKFNNFSCSRSWNISYFYVYLLTYFILYVTFSQIYYLLTKYADYNLLKSRDLWFFKYKVTLTSSYLLASLVHDFFLSNTFISNARLKLAKYQAKAIQHPEAKVLLFQNYLFFSSTLSSKSNRRHSKKTYKK